MAAPQSQASIAAEQAVANADREVQQERQDYHDRIKGRPTPTQHECDLIKAGAPPEKKEADGAGPEMTFHWGPRQGGGEGRTQSASVAGSGGTYQARQGRFRQPPAPPAPQTSAE